MNTVVYSDSVSSITTTSESVDISFGSSNNKKPKKEIAIPVDSIDDFIQFMNIDSCICYHCKIETIKIFNGCCIDCLEYTDHKKKFKKILENMFVCVDKHKISCRYQLKKYIKKYSKKDIKYNSNQDNITFQIKKHIIVYILKQLLQITRKNKVYVLQVYINKCIDILYSNNTMLWLSIKNHELNRPSMIENDTYFSYHNIYIFKNNIYVILQYKLINDDIYNVCFVGNNIYVPSIDNVKMLCYDVNGYSCMVNCLLIHVYVYCIKINKIIKVL